MNMLKHGACKRSKTKNPSTPPPSVLLQVDASLVPLDLQVTIFHQDYWHLPPSKIDVPEYNEGRNSRYAHQQKRRQFDLCNGDNSHPQGKGTPNHLPWQEHEESSAWHGRAGTWASGKEGKTGVNMKHCPRIDLTRAGANPQAHDPDCKTIQQTCIRSSRKTI